VRKPDAGWDRVSDRPTRASAIPSIAAATAWPWLYPSPPDAGGHLIGLLDNGAPFCFDPHAWYETGFTNAMNIAMVGATGSGKSTTACAIALRALAHRDRHVLVIDGKSDWARYAEAYGGTVVRFHGTDTAINMLDVPPDMEAPLAADHRMRACRVLLEIVAERKLTDTELLALSRAAAALPANAQLSDVHRMIANPSTGDVVDDEELRSVGRTLLPPLARITAPGSTHARLLDRPSTVRFDPAAPLFVVSLGDLEVTSDLRECVIAAVQAWMHAATASRHGKRMLVLDEAWQLLKYESAAIAHAERLRLARAFGLSTVMILHRPADISMFGAPGSTHRASVEAVFNLSDVHIIGKLNYDDATDAQRLLHLNDVEARAIRAARTGELLWSVETATGGRRSWLVHTRRTDREALLWNTKV
jgi:type IV secretory pathway VirB4 component